MTHYNCTVCGTTLTIGTPPTRAQVAMHNAISCRVNTGQAIPIVAS